jgi:hypothetical protein
VRGWITNGRISCVVSDGTPATVFIDRRTALDDMSNRPSTMKAVDRLKAMIASICESRLYPHAEQVVEAATDITAATYLILLEGEKPEVAKEFWLEVGMKRGKRPITKLVNYVIDETPPHLRRIVQEMQNEIASAVEILHRDWKPVRIPTFDEVLADIDQRSEHKGLAGLHRRWMSHLSSLSQRQREEQKDLLDIGKRVRRQQDAESRGMTVEQLAAEEERERVEREKQQVQARWNEYINGGTPIELGQRPDWLKTDAIYVEHEGRLVQLSSTDCERVRACMTKH